MASVSTTVTANWTVLQDASGFPTSVSGDDITVYVNNSTPFFSGEAWSDVDLLTGLPSGVTITNVTFSLDVQTNGPREFSGVPMGPEVEFIDKTTFLAGTWTSEYAFFGRGGPGDIPDDNDPHSIVYDNSVYPGQSGGGGVGDMDAFAAALAAGTAICRVQGPIGGATGTGVTYQAPLTVTFFYDSGDLPCDTWVDEDLSAAVQLADVDGPQGQFGDGVIYTTSVDYPNFYFTDFTLDPAKRYRIEVTYDPTSGHDSGGRNTNLYGLRPGSEAADHTAFLGGATTACLGNGNASDVQTITIGPGLSAVSGLPAWDDGTVGVVAGYTRLFLETDVAGAVSSVRVRKVCKTVPPPLRLTNRDDGLAGSVPRLTGSLFRQTSNRLTGPL